jgi:hypothetical protein
MRISPSSSLRSLVTSSRQLSLRTVTFQGRSVTVEETTYFGNAFSRSANSPLAVGQKDCMAS